MHIKAFIRERFLIWLVLLTVMSGCRNLPVPPVPTRPPVSLTTPTATNLAFTKEQAIERASRLAKMGMPEVGMLEARVDSVTAELITLAEAN